jgi:hypothetical protein
VTGSLDKTSRYLAVNLINQFGKSVTLNRIVHGTYDVSTGKVTNAVTSSSINCVLEDFTPWELANGLGTIGGKKVTIASKSVAIPALIDTLTIDSDTFTIASIKTMYSGELPAIYELVCKKS